MNRIKRSLLCALLALALLAPFATATQAEPAAGTPDRWLTSVLDLLAGFFDGLRSVDAASESDDGTEVLQVDGDGGEAVPSWDPNGATSSFETTTEAVPSWDPNG